MDKWMDRVMVWGMGVIVLSSLWMIINAMIEFNKLDLAKIIGG